MHLVMLYGPPGVGKYTIGTELARLTGFKLLHNHLTVNLVTAVFERNSDVWLQLLRRIRREMIDEAARHDVSLILTAVFDGTDGHTAALRGMFSPVTEHAGSLYFVRLTCDRDELFLRLQRESRMVLDKLVDPVRLADLMGRYDMFATLPFEPTLHLDVTSMPPTAAADRIARHFRLPVVDVLPPC